MFLITWLTSVFRSEEQNDTLKKREVFKEWQSLFEGVASKGDVQKFDTIYADSSTILDFFKLVTVSATNKGERQALSLTFFRCFNEHINSQVSLAGILRVVEKFDLSESSWSVGIPGRGQIKEWEVAWKDSGILWLECFELVENLFVKKAEAILRDKAIHPNALGACISDCAKFHSYFKGSEKFLNWLAIITAKTEGYFQWNP